MQNGDSAAVGDPIPDPASVSRMIAAARVGEAAYARIAESWTEALIGKIRIVRNFERSKAIQLSDRIWKEKRREICAPSDTGGYGSGPLILFHEWLFERFNLAGRRGSISPDSPSVERLDYDRTVLEGLRLAREGDDAFESLVAQFDTRLMRLIQSQFHCSDEQTKLAAREIWTSRRKYLLKDPQNGGFNPAGARTFEEFALGCASWYSEYSAIRNASANGVVIPEKWDALKTIYQPRLASVLAKVGPYDWPIAKQNAEACLQGYEQEILSPPGSGGYWPPSHGELTTFIIKHCLQLTRPIEPCEDLPLDPLENFVPQPDDPWKSPPLVEMVELVGLVLSKESGYPHQQLTFLLSKVAYGTGSPRGIEGDPPKVDRKYGLKALHKVEAVLERWFRRSALRHGAEFSLVQPNFDSFRARLEQKVGEMQSPKDHSFRKRHAELLKRKVGDTCIGDYYPPDRGDRIRAAQKAISGWCWDVEEKVRAIIFRREKSEPEDN